jgi:hypothetical protein
LDPAVRAPATAIAIGPAVRTAVTAIAIARWIIVAVVDPLAQRCPPVR